MSKEKIVITGSGGNIGTVLYEGLRQGYKLTQIDKDPKILERPDAHIADLSTEYGRLLEIFPEHHLVVHLAWDNTENWKSDEISDRNKKMFENVYKAASESGVPKVVMASSLHAADVPWEEEPYKSVLQGTRKVEPSETISVDAVHPDKPYGATKAYMEALGRYWAKRGLFVVCVRYGIINSRKEIEMGESRRVATTWMSRRDCVELIKRIVEIDPTGVSGGYDQLYGMSKNSGRVYSYENKLGWEPQDNSSDRIEGNVIKND